MLRHLKATLSLTTQHKKMLLFLYGMNLALGLAVARPFYSTLVSKANGSMALDALVADFDYMIFTDFMRLHSGAFRPLFLVVLLLGFIYVLLMSLFTGGIFAQLGKSAKDFNIIDFLKSGFKTFGKYLLLIVLELLFILCVFFLSGLFYFIFILVAEGGSEREYILWMIPPTAILLLMLSTVVVISDYGRCLIFESPKINAWEGFSKATTFVFKHFKAVGLYWAFIGIGVVVGLIYLLLDNVIGMTSAFTVAVMFVIQQFVVLARVFLKTANYAAVQGFINANRPLLVDEPPQETLPPNKF